MIQLESVISEGKVVVVKVGEDGCHHCEEYDAAVQGLIDEFGDRVDFVRVHNPIFIERQRLGSIFREPINSYPYVVVYAKGERVGRVIGNNVNTVRYHLNRVLVVT